MYDNYIIIIIYIHKLYIFIIYMCIYMYNIQMQYISHEKTDKCININILLTNGLEEPKETNN